MQLLMSAGTLVLGLLMVFLTGSPELALFGWVLAGLGLLGVLLRFLLPPVSRRRADR